MSRTRGRRKQLRVFTDELGRLGVDDYDIDFPASGHVRFTVRLGRQTRRFSVASSPRSNRGHQNCVARLRRIVRELQS